MAAEFFNIADGGFSGSGALTGSEKNGSAFISASLIVSASDTYRVVFAGSIKYQSGVKELDNEFGFYVNSAEVSHSVRPIRNEVTVFHSPGAPPQAFASLWQPFHIEDILTLSASDEVHVFASGSEITELAVVSASLMIEVASSGLSGSTWTGSADGAFISRESDVQVTGNLDVSGILTAQEYHSEVVSASILFESGSSLFGNSSDDIHAFTGSIQQTGSDSYFFGNVGIGTNSPTKSLTIRDASPNIEPTIRIQCSGSILDLRAQNNNEVFVGTVLSDTFNLMTNGVRRLSIIGTGNVGIGVSTPIALLEVTGSTIMGSSILNTHIYTGSLNISGNIEITASATIDGVDVSEFSSSTAIEINDVELTASRNEGTASTHETRLDNIDTSGSTGLGFWTGSAGFISRQSDIEVSGTLNVSGTIFAGISGSDEGTIFAPTGSFGRLIKVTGTFKIPHPNPELTKDKYLVHSFVESPTAGDNIYRYTINVKTKKSIFELPSYFKYLNENSQVWISPVDMLSLCTAKVSKDLRNIEILVDKLGTYNILVIGTRKDIHAKEAWTGPEHDRFN